MCLRTTLQRNMSGKSSSPNSPTPTFDSCKIVTRSGQPPGTPKSPIDPPRRRSSLGFAQFFNWSSPPKKSSASPESLTMAAIPPSSLERTPSNTSKKSVPAPIKPSTVTPGHVAQMQTRFQSAKASLRLDMGFAASPTGSIGSRLPPDQSSSSHSPVDTTGKQAKIPVKDWRYSVAPQLLAAAEVDVREPVPEGSPTLPDAPYRNEESNFEPPIEALSSGFNSPIDQTATGSLQHDPTSERPSTGNKASHELSERDMPSDCETGLERTMTGLKVGPDNKNVDMELDDSPTVSHLKRMSAETPSPLYLPETEDPEIFLSEPAEAAAESAKAKRSLLRRLFPRKDFRDSPVSEHSPVSPAEELASCTPSPDLTLHKLMSMGACPEPSAHLRPTSPSFLTAPMISVTPQGALSMVQYPPSPADGSLLPRVAPFHRASATGSPMPFVRPHTATSTRGPRYGVHHGSHYGLPLASRPYNQHSHRPQTGSVASGMPNPHFEPGWYYAQKPAQPAEGLKAMTYSFSTAAAKIGGQSAAPDSRIRDSYRTDTLTPLAKPPSRFRKTGIGALARARGVSKYYDGLDRMNSRATRPGTSQSQGPGDSVQFHSSPPRASENMAHAHQKRRRPRELEDDHFEIQEDESADAVGGRQNSRPDSGDEPIMTDDETRAAVRMSLYGSATPEALQGAREGIREISPNVTPWSKRMRQPRKKWRPSYWDGDFKQVKEGSVTEHVHSIQPGAERHVMTSPAKEDVESMRVSVREDGESSRAHDGRLSARINGNLDVENKTARTEQRPESMGVSQGDNAGMVDEMEVECDHQ